MSAKKNNVNPNHYKEAGRTRPGQDVPQERNKLKLTRAQAALRRQGVKDSGDQAVDQTPNENSHSTDGGDEESAK